MSALTLYTRNSTARIRRVSLPPFRYDVVDSQVEHREEILSQGTPKPYKQWNTVRHLKHIAPLNISAPLYPIHDGAWREFANYYAATDMQVIALRAINLALSDIFISLPFQKNNSFELIPFLFDIDGTLATFTIKFWKQISYGAINWGVLPFISDITSLINSVRDFSQEDLFKSFKDENTYQVSLSGTSDESSFTQGFLNWKFEARVHIDGTFNVIAPPLSSGLSALYLMLDELGVHPDLKTVWDVIPLSFIADYFLPIGDSLETLHPRGWYNPTVSLIGGYSVKGLLTAQIGKSRWGSTPNCPHEFCTDVYYRTAAPRQFPVRKPVKPEWKCPNARQLFNTAYIAQQRSRRF